ncbi:MAG TPA: hypothetical protein DGV23_02595, partial [Stenotrophomonas sp.]|nr:hypothetical protein [Stenotrophomonas sp.]
MPRGRAALERDPACSIPTQDLARPAHDIGALPRQAITGHQNAAATLGRSIAARDDAIPSLPGNRTALVARIT